MPTIGLFSQQYWNGNRHTNVITPPPSTGARPFYPMWQSAPTGAHSVVFGPPMDLLKRYWARLVWIWRTFRMLWAVAPEQRDGLVIWIQALPTFPKPERAVFEELRGLLSSDTWPLAQQAVQATATTLGFSEPKFWKSISAKIQTDPGHARQLFRHLHAAQQVKLARPDLSSDSLNFVVEAAYHAFTQTPKKTV